MRGVSCCVVISSLPSAGGKTGEHSERSAPPALCVAALVPREASKFGCILHGRAAKIFNGAPLFSSLFFFFFSQSECFTPIKAAGREVKVCVVILRPLGKIHCFPLLPGGS